MLGACLGYGVGWDYSTSVSLSLTISEIVSYTVWKKNERKACGSSALTQSVSIN